MFESSRMRDAYLIEAYEVLVPHSKKPINPIKNDNSIFEKRRSDSNKEVLL
jgi:hypothetical protein